MHVIALRGIAHSLSIDFLTGEKQPARPPACARLRSICACAETSNPLLVFPPFWKMCLSHPVNRGCSDSQLQPRGSMCRQPVSLRKGASGRVTPAVMSSGGGRGGSGSNGSGLRSGLPSSLSCSCTRRRRVCLRCPSSKSPPRRFWPWRRQRAPWQPAPAAARRSCRWPSSSGCAGSGSR